MTALDPHANALCDALSGRVLRGETGTDYRVGDRIGEGVRGWVFRAAMRDDFTAPVALKLLRPEVANAESIARFRREAAVLRLFTAGPKPSPNIVRYLDHGLTEATDRIGRHVLLPFTVLELVRGETLEQAVARADGQSLALDRVRRITADVARALEQVHAQRLVHRDLKPSNVLLARGEAGRGEVAKVTDFELVKVVDVSPHRTTALAGAALGYAPPEQYEHGNARVSPRSDLFALATVLFEMLTGRPAFPHAPGENPLVLVTRLMHAPRPRLADSADALAPELRRHAGALSRLDAELLRALRADPSERHDSVKAFAQAVDAALAEALAPSVPRPSAARTSRTGGPPGTANGGTRSSSFSSPSSPSSPSSSLSPSSPSSPFSRAPSNRSAALDATLVNTAGDTAPSTAARDRALRDAPSRWAFRVASPALGTRSVRAAWIAGDGREVLAVGARSIARHDGRSWHVVSHGTGDIERAHGLARIPSGAILLFGRGLLSLLDATGRATPLAAAETVTFHGAFVAGETVMMVGERAVRDAALEPGRVGVVALVYRQKLAWLVDAGGTTALYGVAPVGDDTWLACGESGALVRLTGGALDALGSICAGHLYAIAPTEPGAAVVVGSGGHALSVNVRGEPHLEAVQTTRDLRCLARSPDGATWAGSTHARVLRRVDGSWLRMSGDLPTEDVVALHAEDGRVVMVCSDGAIVEGRFS
jgi:serine/threonine-protein kinase